MFAVCFCFICSIMTLLHRATLAKSARPGLFQVPRNTLCCTITSQAVSQVFPPPCLTGTSSPSLHSARFGPLFQRTLSARRSAGKIIPGAYVIASVAWRATAISLKLPQFQPPSRSTRFIPKLQSFGAARLPFFMPVHCSRI